MTKIQILEEQIVALKELMSIKNEIIHELKMKELKPVNILGRTAIAEGVSIMHGALKEALSEK